MKPNSTDSLSIEFPIDRTALLRSDRFFFVAMAWLVAATAILAFTTSFLKTDIAGQLSSLWVKAHVIAFSGWILLFIAQTTLVAAHRTDIHRRLGVVGAVLAAAMIALTLQISLDTYRNGSAKPALSGTAFQSFVFYVVPHVDIILFTVLVAAALFFAASPRSTSG